MGNGFCNCSYRSKSQETDLEKSVFAQERAKIHDKHKVSEQIQVSFVVAESDTKSDDAKQQDVIDTNVEDNQPLQMNEGEASHSNTEAIEYESNHEISMTEVTETIDILEYREIQQDSIQTTNWSEQSLEWYNICTMKQLSEFISNHHMRQEKKYVIWNRFDVNKKEKLKTRKYLPQLLYSYIWLMLKSQNNDSSPPKYKQLKHVLQHYSNMIIEILPIDQKICIDKDHYNQHIAQYFDQITNGRDSQISV